MGSLGDGGSVASLLNQSEPPPVGKIVVSEPRGQLPKSDGTYSQDDRD